MMMNNGHLRICQILVFLVSGTAGLVISISVGWTSKIAKGQCVLFSEMPLKKTINGSIFVSLDATSWGKPVDCQFTTFCPVGVTIYCVIWMWFYIFVSDWGTTFIESKEEREQKVNEPDRPSPDQHLLVPSIVGNILVLGFLLATIAMVEAGKSVWCEHIMNTLKEPSCEYVGDVPWVNLKGGQDLYRFLNHASVACWVLLVSMVLQTAIMFVRLRRNSRRSLLEYSDVEEKDVDMIDAVSSDSDDDDTDLRSTRRSLHRQKRVVISDSSSSLYDRSIEVSVSLLDNRHDDNPVS